MVIGSYSGAYPGFYVGKGKGLAGLVSPFF